MYASAGGFGVYFAYSVHRILVEIAATLTLIVRHRQFRSQRVLILKPVEVHVIEQVKETKKFFRR